jgi:hypothetical protein
VATKEVVPRGEPPSVDYKVIKKSTSQPEINIAFISFPEMALPIFLLWLDDFQEWATF